MRSACVILRLCLLILTVLFFLAVYSQKDFQRLKDMIWKDQRDKSGKVLTMADKQRLESDLKTVMRFCLNDVDCRRSQVL